MKSPAMRLHFLKTLAELFAQRPLEASHCVLIYDRRLERISPKFRSFAKKFPHRYPVPAGEALKDLAAFPAHVRKLSTIAATIPARKLTVVAVGGGSVGDFAGFFASVFKRGVRLVHVPTTWLAAIDSSHGGKTALNVVSVKNQIGTFYPASDVFFVREILLAQDERRAFDALGELAKIALLSGGKFARDLSKTSLSGSDVLWKFLKPAIDAKMSVVVKDPFEKSGHRQILNLGHTMGHAFETKYGWPHGFAIAQGLFFAIELSESFGLLKEREADRALELMAHLGLTPARPSKKFTRSELFSLLSKDKKTSHKGSVTFIALRKIGSPERVEIPIPELAREAARQGWVR